MLFASRYVDYDPIAWFYNRYWGEFFAERYFAAVKRLFLSRVNKNSNVLDLCCGSGQLACKIGEDGYRVSGIDGSGQLIKLAKKNAPEADLSTGDARSFTIVEKYGGVISTYDSLNHIPDLVSLGNVFNNVYSALKKEGIFMFDMTMEEGFAERWSGSTSEIQNDHVLATSASYDAKRKEASLYLTTFIREKHWKRTDVTITERCFTRDEVMTRLSKSQFREIKSVDARRDLGADEVGRTFFLCVK